VRRSLINKRRTIGGDRRVIREIEGENRRATRATKGSVRRALYLLLQSKKKTTTFTFVSLCRELPYVKAASLRAALYSSEKRKEIKKVRFGEFKRT
jgi:hypothetical protein